MYRVYVINSLLLVSEGFEVSKERFRELSIQYGYSLSLNEFEELVNSGGFDNKVETVRILKTFK